MNQREEGGNALVWRDVLVLAVEAVLSAELARASFVTFLFSRPAVVTGLGSAHLLSSYLLCGAIVVHVRGLRIGRDRRGVLLGWWWWRLGMIWRSVGVCSGTDGMVVSIWYAAIRMGLSFDSGVHIGAGRPRPVAHCRCMFWQSEVGIRQLS
jgi:hypothetical protein